MSRMGNLLESLAEKSTSENASRHDSIKTLQASSGCFDRLHNVKELVSKKHLHFKGYLFLSQNAQQGRVSESRSTKMPTAGKADKHAKPSEFHLHSRVAMLLILISDHQQLCSITDE